MRELFFLIFALNFFLGGAQEKFVFSGKIINNNKNPVSSANIVVFDGDRVVTYSPTNKEGIFIIRLDVLSSTLHFKILALGYKSTEFWISPQEQKGTLYRLITLQNSVEILDEVFLEGKSKIQIRKDTIIFQASAYQKTNTIVVEDLLKELPGVDINKNGRISVEGKEIQKILIDGKDVFDEQYQIPSKNIDSRDISEVEIIKNFQENSVLKEFYNSDEIAINLKFKTDRKNKIYGTANAGLGLPKKYTSNLTAFQLGENLNAFAIGSLNNIGEQSRNLLQESSLGNLGNYFKIDRARMIINPTLGGNIGNLNELRFIKNRSQFGSLNLYKNFHKKGTFRITGNFAKDKLKSSEVIKTEYNDENNSRFNQIFSTQNSSKKFKTKVLYRYKESENFFLEIKSNFILNNPNKEFNLFQEGNKFEDRYKLKKTTWLNTVNSSIRLGENNGLDLTGYYITENSPQFFFLKPGIGDEPSLTQSYNNNVNSFGIQGNFFSKKNDIKLGYNHNKNHLFSQTSPVNNPFNYSQFENNLILTEDYFFIERGWRFSLFTNLDINISSQIGYYSYTIIDKLNKDTLDNNQLLFNPSISFSRSTKKYGKFTLLYDFNQKPIALSDFFKKPILTNRNSYLIGTSQISKIYKQKISLTHSKSLYKSHFFFRTQLSIGFQNNSLGYNNKLVGTLNYTKLEPNHNNKVIIGSVAIDKVIPDIKSGLGLDYSFLSRYNKSGFNNTKLTTFNSDQHQLKLIFGTYFSGILNFNFNLEGQYMNLKSKVNQKVSLNFSSHYKVNLDFKEKFSMDIFFSQIFPTHNTFNTNSTLLSDIETHFILKKGKSDLFLGIQNIFNEKTYSQSFLNFSSKITRQINLQPTFGYFSFKYRW